MSDDLIPKSDAKLLVFAQQYVTELTANPTHYNHTPAQATALQGSLTIFVTAHQGHLDATKAAKAASQSKDDSRDGLETLLRSSAAQVNADPKVTNTARAKLGLPSRKKGRTPVGVPVTCPVGRISNLGSYRHKIQLNDETTPKSRAKPAGVLSCEMWLKIGDAPPTDPSGYTYLRDATKSPFVHQFQASDEGKTAYWIMRWKSRAGTGPFGKVVSAKINE